MIKHRTYRNVPAEKSNNIPVRHCVLRSSPTWPAIKVWAIIHVTMAPTGAAMLKTTRCVRIARGVRPCFSSAVVKPNDAGALWTMIAMKIMKLRLVLDVDAANAMPSAAAWMTNPRVVAKL